MYQIPKVIFFILTVVLSSSSFAGSKKTFGFVPEYKGTDLTDSQKRQVDLFLKDLESVVPSKLQVAVAHPVKLYFTKKLKTLGFNRSLTYNIEIDASLLEDILRGKDNALPIADNLTTKHKDRYRLTQGVILHELGHIYDSPLLAKDRSDRVSKSRLFRDAMFIKKGMLIKRSKNLLTKRSPDPYEFENPKEGFAVNLEFYLLDEEFACRRPTAFRFYRDHFNFDPFPNRSCTINTKIHLYPRDPRAGLNTPEIDINPERIYQVHFLLAAAGESIGSRWGHGMLRLILCAPGRKEVGPACLTDVEHHVVVSYRANVNDLIINNWKGVIGKYASMVYMLPFADVIEEYTRNEFREAISLPLKITNEEKTRLVHTVLEQVWGYRAKYFFLRNSCASEIVHFLQAVLGTGGHALSDKLFVSPVGLYKQLAADKLIDQGLLSDRKEAQNKGYLFPSEKEKDEASFTFISEIAKNAKVDFPYLTLKEYVDNSNAVARKALFEKIIAVTSANTKKIAAHFLLLESYQQHMNQEKLNKLVMVGRDLVNNPPPFVLLSQVAVSLRSLYEPWNMLNAGYGIPLTKDFFAITADLDEAYTKLLEETEVWLKTNFAAQMQEIDRTNENRALFRSVITAPRV